MTQRMEIGGYLIVQLEDQLTPEKAIKELIDNAESSGATIIDIVLTNGSMSITDNGNGCDDPNLIATPSQSGSRFVASHIGSKAIGAKQACATFGRVWDIQTVPRGTTRYHHYKVKWNPNGPLPFKYAGPPSLALKAPAEIRYGGTKITVTDRQDGFSPIRFEALCRSLEHTYRPALQKRDIKITVRNPEKDFVHQLQDNAKDLRLFSGLIRELQGGVGSRKFYVRFGPLKEYHPNLSYCHIIFGPRVIETINTIGKLALPAGCYIDIVLSDGWKTSLSTNKDRIQRHREELIANVEMILAEWINQQRSDATIFRLKLVSNAVADLLAERVTFLVKTRAGKFEPQHRVKKDKTEDRLAQAKKKKKRKHGKRRQRAIAGNEYAAEIEKRPHALNFRIEPDEKLGRKLFESRMTTNEVVISLNNGPHQREIAEYFSRQKIDDLFKIAVMAFAVMVAQNRDKFPDLFIGLQANGYEISDTDSDSNIVAMISNFLIDSAYGERGSIAQKSRKAA